MGARLRFVRLFTVVAAMAVGCASGTTGHDGGASEGGARDAATRDGGRPVERCGDVVCEPFQYCDEGSCVDYAPCAGNGTCPDPSHVCENRYCVPRDVDIDGDGFPAGDDCDETDPARFPGAEEVCSGVDEDCDGSIDEGDPAALCEFYPGGGICTMGSCGCPPGTFDLDREAPGCECTAMPAIDQGLSCESAIDLGNIADTGVMMTVRGNVMPDDRAVWYRFRAVDSADTSCDRFHVRAQLVTNPGDTFEITVFRGECAADTCGDTGFTDYSWATDFRSMVAGRLTGQCPCYAASGTAMANVSVCENDSADYFVRVRRKAGSTLGCQEYELELSNGVYSTM